MKNINKDINRCVDSFYSDSLPSKMFNAIYIVRYNIKNLIGYGTRDVIHNKIIVNVKQPINRNVKNNIKWKI